MPAMIMQNSSSRNVSGATNGDDVAMHARAHR